MRLIHLYNPYHLGDNIFNFILFYNLKPYLEIHNIFINYYCKPEYINQISEFNCSHHITIKNIDEGKPENAIELWQNNEYIDFTFEKIHIQAKQNNSKRVNYNLYYKYFFNKFLNKINIPLSLSHLCYKDHDLKVRYKRLSPKYKRLDLLVINSVPFSGQYNYNKEIWDGMVKIYNNNYKMVTTTKVEGVDCTMDDNLTIKDIAAISTKTKVIICINSGVVPGLLNVYTLNRVKKVYTFDDRCFYSYPNFQVKEDIRGITCFELDNFIKN
jgi:hypothetical protein